MKLLLDEMISAVVAEQLRVRERDAEAVSERRELRGVTDRDVFEYAQSARRSLVTYNRDDILELDRLYRGEDRPHYGIVILNPRRFPQGPASIGLLVTSLERLIDDGAALPDDVDARLRLEARRRGQSIAQVAREAIERELPAPADGRLGFFAIGDSS